MKPKSPRRRDENEDAAEVVRASTVVPDEPPRRLEAAWADWAKRIQRVDERTMTLFRAAFEAGYESGARMSASELGKRGAKKGGDARAASLSGKRRAAIAKKAAQVRWGTQRTP